MNELEELLKKLISQNYYERLGLPKYASVEQIKAKSREIARIMAQYHPDKATDPDQRKIFNEIFSLYSEARQGLQSEEQKRRYDARLRYEDINSTQSKTVYQKTKTTYTQSTSSGQTSGATSSQTSKQAEPAPGPERKTEEKAPNTKEEAPKSEEKTKVSTTEEEEKEEVKKETTFKGTTTSQSSGQEEKISVKAPEISIKKTYYPTSRALIAQRIIKDIKFTDPNLVIAHAILLINATERETIWGQTILEPLKKPVREIDPEGRPEIQKRLDEEYKQALDLYKRKLEHQYDLAVYAIKIIAAEEKEGIKVISRENTEGEDKTEDSEGTGKTEEGKEPSGPTKPSTSQGEGEYYIDFTGSRVLHIRPRSGFNQKDAAIVTHNPGWQFSSGTTLVATQERVDYYVVPKEYVQGTEHPLVLAGLVTPAGVITASKLLEDRQKRIQETTKYLIDSIAAGEQGEDLQNRLNSDPEGTYKEISKFVEAEQLFHFSQIYPSAANYLADKYPEIAKAIKARNFVNQRLLKEGLVDPKNPLPYDPNVDAYTGTYEITRVAWERYGESNDYKIPSNEQLAQSSLSVRASSIIDFVDKNSELLEKFPQVKNLYEKAAKIKGLLPDATKKLGQEAVKKGAEALARGTTTQFAKSALAKGIASLLAKAGAAIASGGISLLISFIPEIINFLRNPGKYLKKLGEFIGASILALA
ncbi:MAG: DnaJ domain-containing protein, partial [Patescibacteria group bacterium]|nr:DnaJ domain-containing protein [Patescibacteria group bacterium]